MRLFGLAPLPWERGWGEVKTGEVAGAFLPVGREGLKNHGRIWGIAGLNKQNRKVVTGAYRNILLA